MRIDNLN